MKPKKKYITQRAFAEFVGVPESSISKDIKSGRISRTAKGIDWAGQLPRWNANRRRFDKGTEPELHADLDAEIKKLKIRKEELIIGEIEGKLMDVDTMRDECFNFARLHRDKVLAVPALVYPRICEEVDGKTADLIESIMMVALEEALGELSSDLSKDKKRSQARSRKRK